MKSHATTQRLSPMKAAVALTLISALVGCSKRSETMTADTDKKQPPLVTQQTPSPAPPRSPEVVTTTPPATTQPTDRDLDQVAAVWGVPKEKTLTLLRREQALWEKFAGLLKSEDASDTVPMLSEMATALRGTPEPNANGQRLPESFLAMLGYSADTVPGLAGADSPSLKSMKPGFAGVEVENMPEQHILATATQELAKRRPDLLAMLAKERAKNAVPTAADYILFNAITDGLAASPFLQSTGDDSEEPKVLPYGAELMELAQMPNPVYRLIAVRAARSAEPDAKKLVAFYSSFVRETEPAIQQAAIDGLEAVRDTSALDALRRFDADLKARGNADVRRTVEEAIRRLTSRQ